MSVGVRVRLFRQSEGLGADIARLSDLWADGFARHGGPFLAGNAFTAVDAFFVPVATRIRTYGLALPEAASQYAQRLLALPPVQQWIAAGIAETWRDAAHEADLMAMGEIIEDRRAAAAEGGA
jgi:glutathione S-transferase